MISVLSFAARFIHLAIGLLTLCILLRVILSWFPIPQSRFTELLVQVTEPLFQYFRKLPFSRIGMFDLTPLVAYLALELLALGLKIVFLYLGASPAAYVIGS